MTAAALTVELYVQPGARSSGPAGVHDGRPKLKLAAAARDGAANAELVRFLAAACGVPRSAVTLISGQRSRIKRLRIEGAAVLPEWLRP